MRIDFHVHTREHSPCGRAAAEDQARSAAAAGLDALLFTDHDFVAADDEVQALNRRFAPFRMYRGIEVTLLENEHALVIGVLDPCLQSRGWHYSELWEFVRARGGFMALAHPFRFQRPIVLDLAARPPHALEVFSSNTAPADETAIRELAGRLGCRLLSNSDAHAVDPLGKYYNELDCFPADEMDLAQLLLHGSGPRPIRAG